MKGERIGLEIQKMIRGDVFWDRQSRDIYSVDASSYLVRPLLVAFPKDEQDVITILKYAAKKRISVTPRGAGTGLVGSALGSGIILDMRYFDKIRVGPN